MISLRVFTSIAVIACGLGADIAGSVPSRKVLFVVGPSGHAPGTHEVAASARLLKYCVDQASGGTGIETEISEGWPTDLAMLEEVRVVVFTGDMFPPYRFENSTEVFARLMRMVERGCSIVCVHYATSVNDSETATVPLKVQADLYFLLGGFGHFLPGNAKPGTQARIMKLMVSPARTEHPVVRGVRPFSLMDEPYFPIRFDPAKSRSPVTILATAMVPPEEPQEEAVAWSLDRGDGSRSVAILFPHFFENWQNDQLRKLVVNGIYWAAGTEVPADGVRTTLPALEAFQPTAVKPRRSGSGSD